MIELLSDPAVWVSFATLAILEIILGVDNVIFISIVAAKLPKEQRRKAMLLGLTLALVMRVGLLFSIAWIVSLTAPVFSVFGVGFSWRDLILVGGGLFLLYKAATEIFEEVEGGHLHTAEEGVVEAAFLSVIAQIVVLDLVFSFDSVLTAVGIAEHVEVMIAAIVVAIAVMMLAAQPIANFVQAHPSTKMLALAFLVMIGMALVAEGFHFHVEKGFIYAAMAFSGGVEALNLWRQRRRARAAAAAAE